MSQEYTFRIAGSYSPADIPLERLGDYLKALAELFGEPANVHFGALESGSTVARVVVDHVAAPKVAQRIMAAATGAADDKLRTVLEKIDIMLADDNATGELLGCDNVIRVDFAGRDRPKPISFGPMRQDGTVEGTVVRIEGRDKTVHVGIVDQDRQWSLEAPAAMGRQLAALFHVGPVRFHGTGTWNRMGSGQWQLRKFVIASFEVLDNSPLDVALKELRKAGPSDWSSIHNPHEELNQERNGTGSVH